MWIKKLFARVQDEFDASGTGGDGGGAGGMNMEAAVSSIAEGLGFGGNEDDKDTATGSDDNPDGSATGADGKGIPEGGSAKSATDDTAAKPEGKPDDEQQPAGAPRTWRAEAAAKWATLPQEVQQEILKREDDMFKGIEGYKAHAAQGKAFADVVAPFDNVLKAAGADPIQLTREFMQAHITFATGTPAQKQALLQQIVQGYGLELPGAQEADPNAPFVDPQVKALQQKIASLESQLSGTVQQTRQLTERQQAEVRAKLATEVDAFEADPKNIYFAEVAGMIPQLIQGGVAKSLAEAYEKAVMLNPVTREKEIARRTAEASSKAQAEAKAKAEAAAKAAAANVRTRAKNASGTAPLGSIDDTLKETLAKINGRGQ